MRVSKCTHCNTLQHTATEHHLGVIKFTYMSCTLLQHTATHCINTAAYWNTLQHTIILASSNVHTCMYVYDCNILQDTATHSNRPSSWRDSVAMCILLQHIVMYITATCCNALQHTATDHRLGVIECTLTIVAHCNTLQHTATHCNRASPWLD